MAETNQTGAGVRCVIVTPESTILDARCRFVALPLHDGGRGVGRGHAPFIGRLGVGAVRITGEEGRAADADHQTFVEGGFVEVGHDTVTVITQRAVPARKLDAAAARAELDRLGGEKAVGEEAIAARLAAQDAARAAVRAAARGR